MRRKSLPIKFLMLIDIFKGDFWLTSTAALALSYSSSRDWFLDRSGLPHLWSLLKRPCQTHAHRAGVRENMLSHLSVTLTGEKALPLPTLMPEARRNASISSTGSFCFLSFHLFLSHFHSLLRFCCPVSMPNVLTDKMAQDWLVMHSAMPSHIFLSMQI